MTRRTPLCEVFMHMLPQAVASAKQAYSQQRSGEWPDRPRSCIGRKPPPSDIHVPCLHTYLGMSSEAPGRLQQSC